MRTNPIFSGLLKLALLDRLQRLHNTVNATATLSVMDTGNMAERDVVPQDRYPLAQWISVLEETTCALCEKLNGQIIDRDSEASSRFRPPIHINCKCTLAYISRDERGPDGRPTQPDFVAPPADLITKHGHFAIDPSRYRPLKVPAFADTRQFVFKRVKVEGKLVSVIDWLVTPTNLPE